MFSTLVVTLIPSPYQVELFDAIAQLHGHEMNLEVLYQQRSLSDRQWAPLQPRHHATVLSETRLPAAQLKAKLAAADLVVFCNYGEAWIRQAMAERQQVRKAWCFWAERPGASGTGMARRLFRAWRLRTLRNSGVAVWGIGQFGIDGWQQELGVGRRYCNVPYFSNLERFRPEAPRTGAGRQVLYSGQLIQRKGVDLLVAAFLRVLPSAPGARLTLLGDGELARSLKEQCRGQEEQICFAGFADWQRLPHYYQQADLLCVPSRYDGWGLVVPEGLAAGLPVIGTDRMGAALELIQPGQNGWRVPAGQLEPLTAALRDALLLPDDKLRHLQAVARSSVSEHSLSHGARRWFEAARDTLANGSPIHG